MRHRRQGHQLQINPTLPALSLGDQRLPTGFSPRADAVDVAADGPDAIAPAALQGRLRPLQHLLGGALAVLPLVLRQSRGHGALPIGGIGRGEGLIQMGVGLHQGREGHGQLAGIATGWQRPQGAHDAVLLLDLQRHQTLPIRLGKPHGPRVEEVAGQLEAQGASPHHRARRPGVWPASTSTKFPARPSTVAWKRGTCQSSRVWPPISAW